MERKVGAEADDRHRDDGPKKLDVTFALVGKDRLLEAVNLLEEAVASLGVTVEAHCRDARCERPDEEGPTVGARSLVKSLHASVDPGLLGRLP